MSAEPKKRRQITVPIANQPGTLAGVAEALGRGGVNIEAMTVFEGQVHLLVDQPSRAAEALREARYPCLEKEVLTLDLPHAPGAMAKIARALAEAGINIDYGYPGPGRQAGRTTVTLAVSDLAKAEKVV